MKLTREMIESATSSDVAHIMRLLSEDILEALRDSALPEGDGEELAWTHPNGFDVLISEATADADATDYDATVSTGTVALSGGFALFDEGAADLLDSYIEGDADDC